MKKAISCFIVVTFLMIFNLTLTSTSFADDQELFSTVSTDKKPNVLIIVDNSQSMDEDFLGNVVGPWATGSRLLEAKRAIQSVIDKYKSTMRIGLMTYRLNSVDDWDIHNATYFTSYDPISYCPSADAAVLAACQDYCITGNATSVATCQTGCRTAAGTSDFDSTYLDQIITNNAVNSDLRKKYCNLIYPKTQRYENPTDAGKFIYYKLPGTYYANDPQGNAFCYSTGYNSSESVNDTYGCYRTKLGTDDGTYQGANPGQYSNYLGNYAFNPTEEDIALGYNDYGRRLSWYHVGRSWYNNTSPGGGFLHVDAAADTTSHYNTLTAKLALHENDMAGYMNSTSCGSSKSNSCPFVINAGLTPIAGTLQSAINYFKGQADYKSGVNYTSPIQNHCQKNFIIFITDGLPSADKDGKKGTAVALMPDVLAKIDALRALVKTLGQGGNAQEYTFNILTYVIGVGMRQDSRTQLDTMASRGGTAIGGQALYADDKEGILTALDSTLSEITNRSYAFATSSISSSRTADENFIYEATFEPAAPITYPLWKGALKKWSLKADSSLDAVVWNAGTQLQAKDPALRTMQTLIGGSLVKFEAKDKDGTNYVGYQYFNLNIADPVAAQLAADKIIKYVRGYPTDAATSYTNPDNWKLGDIFHSSPITLGTPTPFFVDSKETNPYNPPKKAYDEYREAHPRNSTCSGSCEGLGKRMVIVGANDGQYHAFNATTGNEFWSFIPPNLLPKLQYFAHESASATTGHHFFVDGPTTATDAWLPDTPTDGTRKAAADWKTLVMFSLGRNDRDYNSTLGAVPDTSTKYWSSSASCDTGITEYYDASTAPYYCGYYAFDFTNAPTTLPSPKWTLRPGATTALAAAYAEAAPYLGEPWSTISTGRVKIGGMERWIGVIGGGYNAAECNASPCDERGKGIIVFDLRNGEILWSYHWGTTASSTTSPLMTKAIPSQVALIDGDYDGYLDHGYVGDLNGDLWQIQFCTKADLALSSTCGTSSWKGSLLLTKLTGPDKFPMFMPPTVVRDNSNNIWIYGATGNVLDPMNSSPAAYVYGFKPLSCTVGGAPAPCERSWLKNITSDKNEYCGLTAEDKKDSGWLINLSGQKQQVLAQPIAFDNVLYFTSFVPAADDPEDDCVNKKTGMALLYAISIDPGINAATCTVGTGKFAGERSITVGAGIASKVQLSFGPDGTVKAFVTTSGSGGQEGGTILAPFNPSETQKRAYMLYWKDKRVE